MTTLTVTGIPDLTDSQGQKFIQINSSFARLEGLAVPIGDSQIITASVASPVEGVAYLANTTIAAYPNLVVGGFLVFTKPPNSVSATIVPQVYRGVAGMTIGGYRLDPTGLIWKSVTDWTLYGTNISTWPNGSRVVASTSAQTITSAGGLTLYLNNTLSSFPQTLAAGAYTIVKDGTNIFVR